MARRRLTTAPPYKNFQFSVMADEAEHAEIIEGARQSKQTVSTFLLHAGVERAREIRARNHLVKTPESA